MFNYTPTKVCSRNIAFSVENNIVRNIKFTSGCPGSLQGISKLVEGMEINEAIKRLKGIQCRNKDTSCPDQLSKALEEYIKLNQEQAV